MDESYMTLEDVLNSEEISQKNVGVKINEGNKDEEEQNDVIEIDVVINREFAYKEDSNWGSYAATPISKELSLHLNNWGNLSMAGICQQLQIGSKYTVRLKETFHECFGWQYQIIRVKMDVPVTLEQQKDFLTTILTPLQVKAIYDVYEGQDVIELIKDDKLDIKLVHNFGEKNYPRIRDKILKDLDLMEAMAVLSPYGFNFNMVKKLTQHYGGNVALMMQKLERNPYIMLKVEGIGFKTCDKYALSMGVQKESPFRVHASIKYVLEEIANNDGHCWILLKNLYSKVDGLLSIGSSKIKKFIEQYQEGMYREDESPYNTPEFYIDATRVRNKNEKRIGLSKNYYYELSIYEKLKQLSNAELNTVISKNDLERRVNEAQKEMGFEFTEEQREGIITACNNNVIVIRGHAGTGKTTILRGLLKVLGEDLTYATCALSGKAAQRIQESTGLQSSTIHRLLGYIPSIGFSYNSEARLPVDVIVIDEASMVDIYVFYVLLIAIENGCKVIIQGDVEQLEPIGAGNVLKDLCDNKLIPVVTLTKVHRQAAMSGILLHANEIREGELTFTHSGFTGNKLLGELKDLFFYAFDEMEDVHESIIDRCQRFKKTMDEQEDKRKAGINIPKDKELSILDFQVIVPRKTGAVNSAESLNERLRFVFNDEFKPFISVNKFEFREGDKIIQNGNNYDNASGIQIYNGTTGIILETDITNKKMTIQFEGIERPVVYSKDEYNKISHAWAISIHRSQGSQWGHVVVGIDNGAYRMLTRQLVYTAMTRSKSSCFLQVQNQSLIKAVSTNKSEKRRTYLSELLQLA